MICFGCILLVVGIYTPKQKKSEIKQVKQRNTTQMIEHQQVEATEECVPTQKELNGYSYIIYQDGERLTVYNSDNKTTYMETDILVEQLPEELQNQLAFGISFQTEADLFDFLESYSS